MVYITNYFLCFIQIIFNHTIIAYGFETKKSSMKKWQVILILSAVIAPLAAIKLIINITLMLKTSIVFLPHIVTLVIMHIFLKGSLWKKLFFVIMESVCSFLVELFLIAFCNIDFITSKNQLNYGHPALTYFLVNLNVFSTLLFFIFLVLWKKLIRRERFKGKTLLLFSIFPLSQIVLIYSINMGLYDMNSPRGITFMVGVLISIIANLILLYALLNQQNMYELDLRLNAIQKAWDVEQNHYEEIEARREELAKIRHDLNEQFYVIDELISTNNIDKAQQMLHTLREYVDSTKEYVYCGDPVVNAILEENQRFCDEKNIELTYDLQIPKPLLIEPVSTCSLFSNLLRNAIAAASDVTVKRPCISIKATVNGDYLHVRVDNDYVKTKKRLSKESRKGYGLDILQSIADKYNGQMETEATDNLYSVRIFIENIER